MAKLRNKDSTENWSHKNDYPIEEVWNTYHTLARLIVPRLQAFKALEKHGYCPDFKGMREWNCVIQKMIDAFELMKYANTYSERTNLNRFYPIGNIYLFEKTTIIKSESSDIIYRTGNRDRLEFVTTFKSIVTDFNHFFLFAVPFYFRWNFDFARIFLVAMGHDSVAVNVITVVDAIHLKVVGITCHGNYCQ